MTLLLICRLGGRLLRRSEGNRSEPDDYVQHTQRTSILSSVNCHVCALLYADSIE
jgi:hypothetical protein